MFRIPGEVVAELNLSIQGLLALGMLDAQIAKTLTFNLDRKCAPLICETFGHVEVQHRENIAGAKRTHQAREVSTARPKSVSNW